MQRTKKIALVIGSNRPTRISGVITGWVLGEFLKNGALEYEIVDLADVSLPFLDEPLMPALGEYKHEHTRKWSDLVSSYDGFFFVFPQYNWGYPAVLKNAVDYLDKEWEGKPGSFLTFGTHGGSKAAPQWETVMTGLHMRILKNHIEAKIGRSDVDENWQLKDVSATLAPNANAITKIAKEFEELWANRSIH